ncbi:hypothetical protein BDL97_18G010000 [Sphagnum fallax]|nr:hypothetical protein BDL97_18G010000 [Sphagnum fallax]
MGSSGAFGGTGSSGTFGGTGSSGTFGKGGSSGTFDSSSSHQHQNGPFYPYSYYDPYNNNQRPYTERRGYAAGGGAELPTCRLSPWGIVLSMASFFGSIWILIGIFNPEQVPLGLNCSRVVKANSAFVSEIQVQNLRDPGTVLYTLSSQPALTESINWQQSYEATVEAFHHQEWGFSLNKGSSFKLSHDIKGTAQDTLVLAFIQGKAAFEEWLNDPLDSSKALRWYRIHGYGSKDFEVKTSDEYYVAFGNLNSQDIQFSMELEFHSTLHSTKGAIKTSTFTPERESISFPLSLIGSTFILLRTPNASQVGVDVWEVEVVYVTRWATFIIIWGLIAMLVAVIIGLEKGWLGIVPRSGERVPLMSPDVEQSTPSHAASYPPSFPPASAPPGECYDNHQQRVSDDHLCTVCLDAPKDCFFDPCGHRCTCYACGQRIQRGDKPLCPICRQPINTVHKIFDS